MAEVITETILPGTYVEVRPEGLLTVGAVASGNVGLIGTAERGSGAVALLSAYEEGRARFGEAGSWDPTDPEGLQGNLTLVRALKLLFDNGARTVYAKRVLDEPSAAVATFDLLNGANQPILSLDARTLGAWGNRLEIRVEDGDDRELVADEVVERFGGSLALSAEAVDTPAEPEDAIGSVSVRDQGLLSRYQLRASGTPSGDVVVVNPADRTLTFAVAPSAAAVVRASYWVPALNLRRVTLRFANVQESFTVPSATYLAQRIDNEQSPSSLVSIADGTVAAPQNALPAVTAGFVPFTGGANGVPDIADYGGALEELVEENVQLVVVAGLGFAKAKSAVLAHVEKTENLGRERIAVLGADTGKPDKVLENANEAADKRLVTVAPGLKHLDPETGRTVTLPPYFAAAAVAGKLASLAPHISLTNKTLAGVDDLEMLYNDGQLKALVQNRVLALQKRRGLRVVKGITTHDGAFTQITTRRIIDYVKEGTRMGCNPYIGKLNNQRVRENLRTTLDGFLASLVVSEFLTGYNLEVFADRPMEIRGEVRVTMDLFPTFSIDVIRVIMNLS